MEKKTEGGSMIIKEKAYAKINLFLDVLKKRSDGYHEIRSVMHAVDLCDEVTLTVTPAEYSCITLKIEGEEDVGDETQNLAYIAAERFMDKTDYCATVMIALQKRIPARAGLGGGSSDAAAVLRAMNLAAGNPLSAEALLALGAEIGSDVPFCILGGTRLCTGRGEKIAPYSWDSKGLFFLIALPKEEKSSTVSAYRELDEMFDDFKEDNWQRHNALFSFFEEEPLSSLYNIFESTVLPNCMEAATLRTQMIASGAVGSVMSGSGTAVYGIFTDKEKAESAKKKIEGSVLCVSAPEICFFTK